jgi:hypothetical protein
LFDEPGEEQERTFTVAAGENRSVEFTFKAK